MAEQKAPQPAREGDDPAPTGPPPPSRGMEASGGGGKPEAQHPLVEPAKTVVPVKNGMFSVRNVFL